MAAVGHWHAIKRDLIALSRSADEIDSGTLPFTDLVSIVVASPPGTAVFQAMDAWSKTDQLLANLGEQWSGLVSLDRRHPRPGVEATRGQPLANRATEIAVQGGVRRSKVEMDSMEIEDWIRARGANWGLPEEKIAEQLATLRAAGLAKAV